MLQGPNTPGLHFPDGQAVVEEGPCHHRFHYGWLRGGLSILATRGRRGQGAPSLSQQAGSSGAEEEHRERWARAGGTRAGLVLGPWPGPRGQEGDAGCVTQVAAGRGEAAAQRYRASGRGWGRTAGQILLPAQGLGAGPGSAWRARRRGPGGTSAQASPPALSLPASP